MLGIPYPLPSIFPTSFVAINSLSYILKISGDSDLNTAIVTRFILEYLRFYFRADLGLLNSDIIHSIIFIFLPFINASANLTKVEKLGVLKRIFKIFIIVKNPISPATLNTASLISDEIPRSLVYNKIDSIFFILSAFINLNSNGWISFISKDFTRSARKTFPSS